MFNIMKKLNVIQMENVNGGTGADWEEQGGGGSTLCGVAFSIGIGTLFILAGIGTAGLGSALGAVIIGGYLSGYASNAFC